VGALPTISQRVGAEPAAKRVNRTLGQKSGCTKPFKNFRLTKWKFGSTTVVSSSGHGAVVPPLKLLLFEDNCLLCDDKLLLSYEKDPGVLIVNELIALFSTSITVKVIDDTIMN